MNHAVAIVLCSCIILTTVDLVSSLEPIVSTSNNSQSSKPASSITHGTATPSSMMCDNLLHIHVHGKLIICYQDELLLKSGHCATFNETTKTVSISACPHNQQDGYNMSIKKTGYIVLPRNLSQLNDYMCGPLNRKGLVCDQCADGFGPSITSFGYKCVNCTDAWYHVPLFLLLEFVPITVLYLIVLVFQVSVTSPPMPCFIMYTQFAVLAAKLYRHNKSLLEPTIFNKDCDLRLDMKIVLTFYGIFNLDFLHFNILPTLCLNAKIRFIDVEVLEYLVAFYPIFLIFLTCICVELHGRNFRPLVLVWRPFHKCFVRLRREWNAKNDLIDVFITFFVLSYNKFIILILVLLRSNHVTHITESGLTFETHLTAGIDSSSTYHILLSILVIVIGIIYNILPLLLLLLHPFRKFRSCLSRLHLNFIAVNTFVDKVYGCYRDGLDGGRDMRRFASLYFFLRIAVLLVIWLTSSAVLRKLSCLYYVGILFSLVTLLVALAKPYKKSYMNNLDVLILFGCSVMCHTVALQTKQYEALLIERILLSMPLSLFILYVMIRMFYGRILAVFKGAVLHTYKLFLHSRSTCFGRFINLESESEFEVTTDSQLQADSPLKLNQPLIQPTCTVVSYGTNEK